MPALNGATHLEDEDIDYTDIEEKYVGYISEILSFSDNLWIRYRVEMEEGFDNIIIVDGVPVIDKSKLEKLLTKICKEFGKKGVPLKPEAIFVPWDNTSGKSRGWASSVDFSQTDANLTSSLNIRIDISL